MMQCITHYHAIPYNSYDPLRRVRLSPKRGGFMGLAHNKQILGPKMGLDAPLDANHGTLSKQKECLFGVPARR